MRRITLSRLQRVVPFVTKLLVAGGVTLCCALLSAATVELDLSPQPPRDAGEFPVRTGLPIAGGALADAKNVRLLIDGKEADLQTEVLARYNDGSVKWLLLDFVAKPGAKIALEYGAGVQGKAPARSVNVVEDAAGITVDTGRLKAVIRRDGSGLPGEIFLDPTGAGKYAADSRLAVKDPSRANRMDYVHMPTIESQSVMSAVAEKGTLDPSKVEITELKAEVKGPLHAVVKVAGNYRYREVGTSVEYPFANPVYAGTRPKDAKRIPFVMRLHFWRDRALMEVQHTFVNEADPDRDFATDLLLSVPAPADADAVVTVGRDGAATKLARGPSDVVGLSQTSADHFAVWKTAKSLAPGIAEEGKRAAGWLDVSGKRRGVTAAIWRSWQNYPKAIQADLANGELRVYLWPSEAGPMNLRRYTRDWGVGETGAQGGGDSWAWSRVASRGVAKTHRVLFNWHEGQAAPPPSVAWFLDRVYAWPSAEYLCATRVQIDEAFSPAAPGKYDELERMNQAVLDWYLFSQEAFRWYGMFSYGDVQQCFQNVHPMGRWESDYGRWGWFNGDASGNKPCSALLVNWLRTGRRDLFDYWQAEVLHIIDVDMVNAEEIPWNAEKWQDMRGCTHRHNAQHWACYFIGSRGVQAHNFSSLYYFTGDERVRDVMDVIAEGAYLETTGAQPSRGGHSSGRDCNWRTFYALERTGDKKWRDLIASKWDYLLNYNRGAAPPAEADEDLSWVKGPADKALTAKRDYTWPSSVVGRIANGIRYIKDRDARDRYRRGLEEAVKALTDRFKSSPQGMPRDQWPGPVGGPAQGNWNELPNDLPIIIHAFKVYDAAAGGQ